MGTSTGDYRAKVKARIGAKRAAKERLRAERKKNGIARDKILYPRAARSMRGVFIPKVILYSLLALPVIALAYIIYVNVIPYI